MSDATLRLIMGRIWKENANSYKEQCKARLWRWSVNWRTRIQLKGLDHDQLKDIGISRSGALEEARKPFWID